MPAETFVLVGVGAAVYFIAAQLLGAVDIRELKSLLRPRRGQAPVPPSAGESEP